jgi:acetyltransferase-like isoleucine patch superfamily enzyme
MSKIQKIKKVVHKDFSGYLVNKYRSYRIKTTSFFSTLWTYIKIRYYKIKIGKGTRFYGTPIINRSYNSKIQIGKNCSFRSDKISNLVGLNRKCIIATFGEGSEIIIGNNSGFSGTVIGAANKIIIGNDVLSGANVLITDFDWHPIDPIQRHTSEGVKSAPVIIKDNVWIGINSVILKGVTIGENTVIGANSVVVKDIPANVIAAGNPCKKIKNL